MSFFTVSLVLAICTIYSVIKKLGLKGLNFYFSFFPFLFVYLGFISTILSFGNRLESRNFLVVQLVILFLSSIVLNPYKKIILNKINISFKPSLLQITFLVLLILILTTSFLIRFYRPVSDYDDKTYRASTPLYWIQNKSIFRFDTINERKNTFIYGSALVYMWPNLFQTGDRLANIFYWLSFPLSTLSVFLFSGLFTKKSGIRIFSALLFTGTPIIFNYFSTSLTQESWLGIILLSLIYFLIKNQSLAANDVKYLLIAGCCFAVALSIKYTSVFYALLLLTLLFTAEKSTKVIIYTLSGFVIAALLSGFLLISGQNYKIYDSPIGSEEIYSAHIAKITPNQIKTQLTRIPFVFMEPPLLSTEMSEKFSGFLNGFAKALGTNNVIEGESEKGWTGLYNYKIQYPNRLFGLGGMIWLASFFAAVFFILRNRKSEKITPHVFFVLSFVAVLVNMTLLRWLEGSLVPYRHIMSSFTLATGFLSLYIEKIAAIAGRYISLILVAIFIPVTIHQIAFHVKWLNVWHSRTNERYEKMLFSPYYDVLININHPTTFLIVDTVTLADYPFFLQKSQNVNKVYLFNFRRFINNRLNNEALLRMFNEINPEYLVIGKDQPYNTIVLEGEILSKLTLLKNINTRDFSAIIYLNKSFGNP